MQNSSFFSHGGGAWLRWLPTFVGFPIGSALAFAIIGPVEQPLSALLGGALNGLVLGAVQAFVLRRQVPVVQWAAATAIGLAAGLALGSAAVGYRTGLVDLAVQGAVSGAAVGLAQAIVLRGHLAAPWRWPLLTTLAWTIGWIVTVSIGVNVSVHWTVFGSGGAVVAAALTGLLPVLLARQATAAGAQSAIAATR